MSTPRRRSSERHCRSLTAEHRRRAPLGFGAKLVRSIGTDRVGGELEDAAQELRVVDRAGVDAQSRAPQDPDQLLGEHEGLDRDAADSRPERPRGERLGRVAGPDHEPRGDPVRRGDSARLGVEADHLDPISGRLPPQPVAERFGGAAGEPGICVRLDLELDSNRLRHQFDELVEKQWMFRRRASRGVTDQRRPDVFCGRLVRPPLEGGPEHEQRIVQQDESIVGGQADVGFDAVDRAAQGVSKRSRRGVWTVLAAEPVGI